jgi:hypothetical protein
MRLRPRDAAQIGGAFRIAPSRSGEPAAQYLRFWVENSEIYASVRNTGRGMHLSIHSSGDIHLRLEGKDKESLSPLLPLAGSGWRHAVELRYLLGDNIHRPLPEDLKGKPSRMIEVAPGQILILNLLVGDAGTTAETELPEVFDEGITPIWTCILADGRPVVLCARVGPINQENAAQLNFIRNELNPKINYTPDAPKRHYLEVHRMQWSPTGGNVISIVPMGPEGLKVDLGEETPTFTSGPPSRAINVHSPAAQVVLYAPKGDKVGTVEFHEQTTSVELRKGFRRRQPVATVSVELVPGALLRDAIFQTPTILCECPLSFDGGHADVWQYSVKARYKKNILTVSIQPQSSALRNANLRKQVPFLGGTEELVVQAPRELTHVHIPRDNSTASALLVANLLLRDQ